MLGTVTERFVALMRPFTCCCCAADRSDGDEKTSFGVAAAAAVTDAEVALLLDPITRTLLESLLGAPMGLVSSPATPTRVVGSVVGVATPPNALPPKTLPLTPCAAAVEEEKFGEADACVRPLLRPPPPIAAAAAGGGKKFLMTVPMSSWLSPLLLPNSNASPPPFSFDLRGVSTIGDWRLLLPDLLLVVSLVGTTTILLLSPVVLSAAAGASGAVAATSRSSILCWCSNEGSEEGPSIVCLFVCIQLCVR